MYLEILYKNFNNFISEFSGSQTDIFLNISDNLKYAANIYATKKFLLNYVIPKAERTSNNYFFENCIASAILKLF